MKMLAELAIIALFLVAFGFALYKDYYGNGGEEDK
jgi:hypothetical protein